MYKGVILDLEKPIISNPRVTNLTASGYTVTYILLGSKPIHSGEVKNSQDIFNDSSLRTSSTQNMFIPESKKNQTNEDIFKIAFRKNFTSDMLEIQGKKLIDVEEKMNKNLKGKKITYPVYIDMEDNTYQAKKTKAVLASVCNTFCDAIRTAGYTPGVYASLSWFNNKIGTITSKHTKWVAQYNTTCDYKGSYDIWQYSASGRINGINGNVDMNTMVNNIIGQPTKKSVDELAFKNISVKH